MEHIFINPQYPRREDDGIGCVKTGIQREGGGEWDLQRVHLSLISLGVCFLFSLFFFLCLFDIIGLCEFPSILILYLFLFV